MDKLTIATYDRTIRTSFSNGNSNCKEYHHEYYKRNKNKYKVKQKFIMKETKRN